MEKHNSIDDAEFITRFRSCTFPPEMFTHEAHMRLAWICLQQNNIDEAIKHVCEDLFRFVHHLGASDKYHATLTVASVNLIAHFQRKSPGISFNDFIVKYPQLTGKFREILLTYYSDKLLFSDGAKNSFVEPDLLPFTI